MIAFQQSETPTLPAAIPGKTTVDDMASVMLEMAFAGQNVDAESLALVGFTNAEIRKHGTEARDLATSKAIRRVS